MHCQLMEDCGGHYNIWMALQNLEDHFFTKLKYYKSILSVKDFHEVLDIFNYVLE